MSARPEAPAVAKLIAAYCAKPGNEAGGNCHVVLDDRNIEDDFVRSALGRCEEAGDEDGAAIMRLFAQMKRTGRGRTIDLAHVLERQARCAHVDIAIGDLRGAGFGKPVLGRCFVCGFEKPVAVRLLLTAQAEAKNNGPWCVDEAGTWTRPEADGACVAVVSDAEPPLSPHQLPDERGYLDGYPPTESPPAFGEPTEREAPP